MEDAKDVIPVNCIDGWMDAIHTCFSAIQVALKLGDPVVSATKEDAEIALIIAEAAAKLMFG